MTEQLSAQEILQRLLDERYEAGRKGGYDAGHKDGLGRGYHLAMIELQDYAKTKLREMCGVAEEPERVLADHPGDENEDDLLREVERVHAYLHEPSETSAPDEKVRLIDCQPPYLKHAFAYIQHHPGTTSAEAKSVIRAKNAFYTLARLGLAEKRGSQFYAKEGARA